VTRCVLAVRRSGGEMKRNADIGPLMKPSVLDAQQPLVSFVELDEALVVAARVGVQLLGFAAV